MRCWSEAWKVPLVLCWKKRMGEVIWPWPDSSSSSPGPELRLPGALCCGRIFKYFSVFSIISHHIQGSFSFSRAPSLTVKPPSVCLLTVPAGEVDNVNWCPVSVKKHLLIRLAHKYTRTHTHTHSWCAILLKDVKDPNLWGAGRMKKDWYFIPFNLLVG